MGRERRVLIHGSRGPGSATPGDGLLFQNMQRSVLGLAVACAALLVPAATAAPPDVYPLSSVRRGQVGYGMTTFQGTTPERFEFEVIGVQENFVPGLPIILVKSS